ncbi:uncharacterized protein LOC108704166 isoform X1 [Xenopus laevis]|uniref:Ig-like domain-containing protein n=2 Tax=Xenopus laevis TaxID=8355 RepID=A0A974DTT8_XENLA|nr:uncharacterized protein LOC108704166 isoform X1 [Xenopus laevis]OCT96702.1 hypothetical protein XELAEV_18008914mg [Xenopus laevis]
MMIALLYLFSLFHLSLRCAALSIIQTPKNLSVTKGDNVCITCSWEAEDQDERIRVWWKVYYESASAAHNGTVLASVLWINNKTEVRIRSRDQSDYQLTKDKAQLWLFSVNESDAGNYICEVIIDKPEHRSGKGKGTTLYVIDSSSSPVIHIWWNYSLYIWIPFAILISVIIVTIPVIWICKRKREPTALYSDHTYGNFAQNEKDSHRKISPKAKKHHPSRSKDVSSVEKGTRKQHEIV